MAAVPPVTPPGLPGHLDAQAVTGDGATTNDADGVDQPVPPSQPPTPPVDPMFMFMTMMTNMQQQAAAQQLAMQQAAEAAAAAQAAQMTKMMEITAAGQKNHHANVRLDIKNFSKIDKFSNKREDWRQWRKYFMSAIRESDADFANFLERIAAKKKGDDSEEDEDKIFLGPTQVQLSAVLHSRLESLTNGEAAGIVELSRGNGVEAWKLLG